MSDSVIDLSPVAGGEALDALVPGRSIPLGLLEPPDMWLDFAEDQAKRQKQIFLRDWQEKLEQFLTFNDREVLQGAGNISKKQVDEEDFYK